MKYWYHFAIMFEALFILTTIDTGTRIGRFLVGEFRGRLHRKLRAATTGCPASLLATALVVPRLGARSSGPARSPRSGRCSASPISCSRAVALCVATTMLVNTGKARYAWVTLVPLSFVATTTLVAGWMSITDNFLVMTKNPDTAAQGWIDAGVDGAPDGRGRRDPRRFEPEVALEPRARFLGGHHAFRGTLSPRPAGSHTPRDAHVAPRPHPRRARSSASRRGSSVSRSSATIPRRRRS